MHSKVSYNKGPMKFLLFLLLFFSEIHAHEKEIKTNADFLATAKYEGQKHHPWPFPLLSIGHNMQSYQFYGGSPYWHDGLDIRSNEDQPIYSSVGGKVVNIENYVVGNPLYWEVAILDDEGFVWKYHHVDKKSIPQEIMRAFKDGSKITAGTLLGNVVRWSMTTYGELYHHLHLLVVARDGRYINPFLMMEPLADSRAPVIRKIGLAKNHRPYNGHTISGPHSLYLEASDLVLHDKFILPPHKITFKIDGAEEKLLWEFINLPSGKNDTDYIKDFYLDGTCGNYNCRQILINLNFSQSAPRNTMTLNPGTHSIEVTVEDIVGNSSTASYQWQVI
jgi:Peptidase family M23